MTEITVRLPDDIYERIRRDANALKSNPEQVAADSLQMVFSTETEPLPNDIPSTIARTRAWLLEQPRTEVRPPLALGSAQQEKLDRDLDDLLAGIQQRTKGISSDQVQQDVNEAVKDS